MKNWLNVIKRILKPATIVLSASVLALSLAACTGTNETASTDAKTLEMEQKMQELMAQAELAKKEAEIAKVDAASKLAEAEKVAKEFEMKQAEQAAADAEAQKAAEDAANLQAQIDQLAQQTKLASESQKAELQKQAAAAKAELAKKQKEAAEKAKQAEALKAELAAKAQEAQRLAEQAAAAEAARVKEEAEKTANATKAAEAAAALALAKKELEDKTKWPEVIRFGAVPGENQTALDAKFKKFAEDLGKYLDRKVTFTTNSDYTATIEALRAKKIEFAEFGPFSYIIANERSNAYAFAAGAKGKDKLYYNSLFIVPANSPAKTIADLKGKKFLFVDPASSSGHLYPKAMLMKELNLSTPKEAEEFFGSVSFSGTHDASALAVAKGDADGAAVADNILATLIDKGAIKASDIRIILKSENIPISPFAYRGDLPTDLVEKVKKFMYTYNDPELFAKLKINGFYPVEDAAYEPTRRVAKSLGMSPEQLLK